MVTQKPNGALVAGACAAALLILPLEAWLLMLVLGAVHGVVAVVPAVGFGTALLLLVGVGMLTGYLRKLLHPAK
ncbi:MULTISPECIES: hypothetical protein [unclassified Streptomyces]|uniref:hypothetical protein n=1 Tax=unclassified Streptomyces TaxID=2593676 RepID=UPI0033CD3892